MAQNIPHVAVIGGLWELSDAQRADAQTAGELIGKELAKAGFGLVVYFSHAESLEPHVVAGYLEGLEGKPGSIHVRCAESQDGEVRFNGEKQAPPDLFRRRLFPGSDWEAPFYRSLVEKDCVDAVLLLGGARSTLIAGQIAVARDLPILAVNSFGGAAKKIWSELASRGKTRDAWGTRPPAEMIRQLKIEYETALESRQRALRREHLMARLTSETRKVIYAAAAFASLLVILLLGLRATPVASTYPFLMLLGVSCAGATGALVRTIIWGPKESVPRTSLLLGSVAGFVVGLAYLLPQWVGNSDVLAVSTNGVTSAHKIQFAYAVLVAVSAGVGFDTVFNRLREEASKYPIGPRERDGAAP